MHPSLPVGDRKVRRAAPAGAAAAVAATPVIVRASATENRLIGPEPIWQSPANEPATPRLQACANRAPGSRMDRLRARWRLWRWRGPWDDEAQLLSLRVRVGRLLDEPQEITHTLYVE